MATKKELLLYLPEACIRRVTCLCSDSIIPFENNYKKCSIQEVIPVIQALKAGNIKKLIKIPHLIEKRTLCSQNWRTYVYGLHSKNRWIVHAPRWVIALTSFITYENIN